MPADHESGTSPAGMAKLTLDLVPPARPLTTAELELVDQLADQVRSGTVDIGSVGSLARMLKI